MSLVSLVHMNNELNPEQDQPITPYCHSCHHDLESFYYLLVWLLLRHADHNRGADACSRLFDGEVREVLDQKSGWLSYTIMALPGIAKGPRLFIRNNPPLTALVDALNTIFYTQNTDQNTPATHESLLAAFDMAIGSAGWPENDAAKSNFQIGGGNGSTSYWRERVKAAVVVPRAEQEAHGPGFAGASPSGVKRKRDEGEEGLVQPKRRSTRTRKTIKH
jgi:hypothetical protein